MATQTDIYQLNLIYGLLLTFPDSNVRDIMLWFVVGECRQAGGAWINWVIDLPDGHNVKDHWFLVNPATG